MSKRLSQLNQIEQATPENYMLLDGENFLESKKVKLKDIDIENFNTTKIYNREQADEEFISKTNVQQIYDPENENPVSGKAVADAIETRIPKIPIGNAGAPFDNVLMQANGYVMEGISSDNLYYAIGSDTESIDPQPRFIARRDSNGNLQNNTPVKDLDCANKKYVDDLIGDIETLLGGI